MGQCASRGQCESEARSHGDPNLDMLAGSALALPFATKAWLVGISGEAMKARLVKEGIWCR